MHTWHIIGSHGYIASRLLSRPKPQGINILCYSREGSPDTAPFDLENLCSDNFKYINEGDFVIFFAAVSSPDFCNNNYETAYKINVIGTKDFIAKCVSLKANVLFFSSDVVIGPTNQPADETVKVNPFGSYGQMKYIIEQSFAYEKRVKVFRLSYVLSRNDKFMKYLEKCSQQGDVADVFSALYRNVVYIEDVIDAIYALADSFDQWENNVFHICGSELLSRIDLAEIFRARIDTSLQIITRVPDKSFFEARPNTIETSSLYLRKLLNRKPIKISEAIQTEFLNNR